VAVVDLTGAYPDCLRARRGFALIDGKHVLIVDEFTPKTDLTVAWQMHTRAMILPDDEAQDCVELNHPDRDGQLKRFFVRILEPSDARLRAECALVNQPKEWPHPGVCKLVATLTRAEPTRIAVYLSPDRKPVKLKKPLNQPLWAWLDWAGEKRRAEKKKWWKRSVRKLRT